jgi:hypothetical protein
MIKAWFRKRRVAVGVGTVALALTLVVLASCRSPTPPSLVSVRPGLERSADHVSSFDFEVLSFARHDIEVYVHWEMTYSVGDTTVLAPGISHLRFDDNGRIAYHRDYWDASAAIALFVPPVAAVLQAVRSRL